MFRLLPTRRLERRGMMQRDKRYIAFVCTGNTCRSPMAEAIFNKLANESRLDVAAESFGIAAVTGTDVSQNSVIVCKEIGVDLSDKKSVSVNDADMGKYEKFYCMSNSHAKMLSDFFKIPYSKIGILNTSDPFGAGVEVYRQCRDQIYNSVKEIIKTYEN